MGWEEIRTALVGLAVAIVTGLVGKFFGVKIEGERRNQLAWAIEQGVAYAYERYRGKAASGADKKELAVQMAKSLAPKALEKAGDEQVSKLIDATYAKMRASLPHSSLHYAAGDIPVDVVEVQSASTPIPRYKGPKPS